LGSPNNRSRIAQENVRRLIAGPEEERYEWKYHFVSKIFAEEENFEHSLDWNNA